MIFVLYIGTPGCSRNGPMNYGLPVLPPICRSIQKFSWDCLISFFLKHSMMLEAHVVLRAAEPDFLGKKCATNVSRIGLK